jgi:hypothetical protein
LPYQTVSLGEPAAAPHDTNLNVLEFMKSGARLNAGYQYSIWEHQDDDSPNRIGAIPMKLQIPALVFASILISGSAFAAVAPVPDQPTNIDGVSTVCTGAGSDARSNSRWAGYPSHVEFVGRHGQYLGDETVRISGNGKNLSIHCGGPWLLMKLPKGSYDLSADVAGAGHKQMRIFAPGRVIARFPGAGGSESPES